MKLICCEMNCGREAEWEITWEEPLLGPADTYTHSCEAHIGVLLGDRDYYQLDRLGLEAAKKGEHK